MQQAELAERFAEMRPPAGAEMRRDAPRCAADAVCYPSVEISRDLPRDLPRSAEMRGALAWAEVPPHPPTLGGAGRAAHRSRPRSTGGRPALNGRRSELAHAAAAARRRRDVRHPLLAPRAAGPV